MTPKLKPLNEQVIVITGASSGIGLATAEGAAQKGAKLVLAARSEQALGDIASRLDGATAVVVGCDVADRAQIERVAAVAIERFGRIDTWVNDAGVAIYGRLEEVSDEDSRRLFETNFWGVVNGSIVALRYLRQNGGALINVGSEVSDAVVPLLGMYNASKHAVKGFTDTLRIEVQEVDDAPVSITLIQPTSVDTPFPEHARNYQEEEAAVPKPMVDPKDVADAILDAAVNPTRAKKVGSMARVNVAVSKFLPALGEKLAAKRIHELHYDEPARNPDGALHRPSEDTGVVGRKHGAHGRIEQEQD